MRKDTESPVSDVLARKSVDIEELEDFEFEKDTTPAYITDVVGRVAKNRRYISDPSDAPEDASVEEGPQGGYYYESEGGGGGGDESDSEGGSVDVDVESEEDLQELYEGGWDETTDDRGVLDEVDISYDDFAQAVEAIEHEMGGGLDTVGAAGMLIQQLQEETGQTDSPDESDMDTEDSESEDESSGGSTLWEDELVTNYSDGDTVTVETDRAGEITGEIADHEWIEEFGELYLEGEDGSEYSIPVDDIEHLE